MHVHQYDTELIINACSCRRIHHITFMHRNIMLYNHAWLYSMIHQPTIDVCSCYMIHYLPSMHMIHHKPSMDRHDV